ncbi:hypothetical protein B0J17DRAFT_628895 [Rhizoctonia solani]|nr:hypothetical protein B0J17DRAFT_628895 [Rhizoctonia solani]
MFMDELGYVATPNTGSPILKLKVRTSGEKRERVDRVRSAQLAEFQLQGPNAANTPAATLGTLRVGNFEPILGFSTLNYHTIDPDFGFDYAYSIINDLPDHQENLDLGSGLDVDKTSTSPDSLSSVNSEPNASFKAALKLCFSLYTPNLPTGNINYNSLDQKGYTHSSCYEHSTFPNRHIMGDSYIIFEIDQDACTSIQNYLFMKLFCPGLYRT